MKFKKTYVWFVVLVVLMTGVLAACQSGFKVTYSAGENGTLTATADGESFVSGSKAEADKSIEFAAAPNSGYTVDVWTVNGTVQTTGLDATGTKLTLIADKELEVSVTFKRLYNVVWELDGGHWPTGYTPVTGVAEGDKLSAPSAVNKPVKDGYTFLGCTPQPTARRNLTFPKRQTRTLRFTPSGKSQSTNTTWCFRTATTAISTCLTTARPCFSAPRALRKAAEWCLKLSPMKIT